MAPESVDETHFRENVIGLELPNEPAHNWSCDPLSERESKKNLLRHLPLYYVIRPLFMKSIPHK